MTKQEPDIAVDVAAALHFALHGDASNLMADKRASWMRPALEIASEID